jgi:hypothetical protein
LLTAFQHDLLILTSKNKKTKLFFLLKIPQNQS